MAGGRQVVKNPALLDLEPDLRHAYGEFLLFLADSELVIGHRHSEWTGFGPSAEEDVAFSSIAQDEMGHAHLYYALYAGADDEQGVDSLALDRGPRQFRHLPLLHAPNGDWFFTIARHLYWDVFEQVVLEAALESRLPLLASAARRVLNEERYHLEHAVEWLDLLSAQARQARRLQSALQRVCDIGGDPFVVSQGMVDLGKREWIRPSPELAARFGATLSARLEAAGWPTAAVAAIVRRVSQGVAGKRPPGFWLSIATSPGSGAAIRGQPGKCGHQAQDRPQKSIARCGNRTASSQHLPGQGGTNSRE